ncbi:hypothetical protein ACHAWU_002707 [Discostella pseudostelligera]|uniref:FAD/NAD(P)-binding domain-containing protein n=1 Tax=Discostella pseudostelligera TaxID=259834 RepID=A0ABD3MRC6_9STRA
MASTPMAASCGPSYQRRKSTRSRMCKLLFTSAMAGWANITIFYVLAFTFTFTFATAFAPTTPIMRCKTQAGGSALFTTTDENSNDEHHQPHIVILGGGFGGINTALTLASLPWPNDKSSSIQSPKITLIDKSERFVFLPLLYELCVEDASLDEVAPTFKSLLDGVGSSGNNEHASSSMISFLQAQIEGIDVTNQNVIISKSDTNGIENISYDALVVATGAEISLDSIPGASEYALPFYTVEQALELKRRLALLDNYLSENTEQSANIVVVGGGYSGVELSLNLVDRFKLSTNNNVQVTLVHRGKQVLEYATEFNRKTGLDRLMSAGVKVMTSKSVVEVLPHEDDGSESLSPIEKLQCILKLRDKNEEPGVEIENTLLPTTLLLWTAGATPISDRNKGIRNSILPRDVMGRILTTSTLNVPEYPNVFAVGDCSRPTKVPYPATAQVAIQQATVAAVNIYTTLVQQHGGDDEGSKVLRPFKYLNLGEAMSLGSDDATISTLGGNVELRGPTASWIRRWLYAVRMPTPKQGLVAAVDGTGRKLARGAFRSRSSKAKPIDGK